tara:strand:+ start:1983 stop:3239 length:1257 start_codon:yes stop_codon:yes gene_type:complete
MSIGQGVSVDTLVLTDKCEIVKLGDLKVGDKILGPESEIEIKTLDFYEDEAYIIEGTGKGNISRTAPMIVSHDYVLPLQINSNKRITRRTGKRGNTTLAFLVSQVVDGVLKNVTITTYSANTPDKVQQYDIILKQEKDEYMEQFLGELSVKYLSTANKRTACLCRILRGKIDYWEAKKHPVAPYFLGLFLGDGNKERPLISTIDPEVEEAVETYAKKLNLTFVKRIRDNVNTVAIATGTKGGGGVVNPLLNNLREINVLNNKHIPLEYIMTSRKKRLKLLAGLLDTDGSIDTQKDKAQRFQFSQLCKVLTAQVVLLARTLGYNVNHYERPIRICTITETNKGVTKTRKITGSAPQQYVIISGKNLKDIPMKIERKKVIYDYIKLSDCPTLKITPNGRSKLVCLNDGNDRFLTHEFYII